jgi:hypothetical protein
MSTSDTLKAVNDLTNKSIERAASLSELNFRIWDKLANRQVEAMAPYFDHAVRLAKLATEAKGYNEFFKGQVDATKDLSERVVADSKSTLQAFGEVRDDYRDWLETSLADVSSGLRKNVAIA